MHNKILRGQNVFIVLSSLDQKLTNILKLNLQSVNGTEKVKIFK